MGDSKEAKRREKAGKRKGINKKEKVAGCGGARNTVTVIAEMPLAQCAKTVCRCFNQVQIYTCSIKSNFISVSQLLMRALIIL